MEVGRNDVLGHQGKRSPFFAPGKWQLALFVAVNRQAQGSLPDAMDSFAVVKDVGGIKAVMVGFLGGSKVDGGM